MPILPVRTIGDPVLRTRAQEVTVHDDALRRLVADMHETMLDVGGVGLAAPQVGVSLRVFTWAVEGSSGHVVNPVLEVGEEPQEGGEGCLSVPGLGFETPRRNWARVTGTDVHGEPLVVEGTGLLARLLQHETDHLDGRLYVDRLEGPARREAMRALRAADYGRVVGEVAGERAGSVGSSFGAGSRGAAPGPRRGAAFGA
ncbi:peptide deformylase [Kocuria flava]|uniref:Peptide deformylase n=1 Tax=Kocuria flava TaxID=446860 RepID=A0A2N4T3Z2_9MICC|nr:peptide deformylase [Kocuria flava]PLC12951.1 peptide deformylase [Kocuria flava]